MEFEEFEYLDEYLEEIQETNSDLEENDENDTGNILEEHGVKFFTTSSGNEKLSFNQFLFHHDKRVGSTSYFKCANKDLGCRSRVKVITENGIRNVYPPKIPHNHIVKPFKEATEIALSHLREKAVADCSRPCQILNEFVADPENRFIKSSFPSKNALTQRVQRTRVKNNAMTPPEPDSLNFEYDRQFCSLNNECIILSDWCSIDGSERISLFTISRFFNFLCDSEIWLVDGTFKTCPKLFYQLFIIHGNLPGDHYVSYPLLFVLMTGKSINLYDKALNMIKETARYRGKRIRFTHALCDFEKAIHTSFKKAFPSGNYTGCLFHLDQNIIKRVKKLKMYGDFLHDQSFYLEISYLMSLAYIPSDEILVYFNELYPNLSQKAQQVAIWFKINYIEGINGSSPRYNPIFWSIYENFVNGYPTTQNWAESYHHKIHCIIDAERQPIYKFLSFLKKEFASIEVDIDKYLAGKPQKHRVAGYEKTESAVKVILNRRQSLSCVETLKALANVKNDLRP